MKGEPFEDPNNGGDMAVKSREVLARIPNQVPQEHGAKILPKNLVAGNVHHPVDPSFLLDDRVQTSDPWWHCTIWQVGALKETQSLRTPHINELSVDGFQDSRIASVGSSSLPCTKKWYMDIHS